MKVPHITNYIDVIPMPDGSIRISPATHEGADLIVPGSRVDDLIGALRDCKLHLNTLRGASLEACRKAAIRILA